MVDVSPVPKTLRASFPTLRDAEQAFYVLRGSGFHINDIGWFRSGNRDYTDNISGPQSDALLSSQSDRRDKLVADAEKVLASTDPSRAVGDVNPGLVNSEDGYARITMTVSDDRYGPAVDIIKEYGGQIF